MLNALPEWLSHIETLHPKTIELGLERVRLVGEALGAIRFECPVITVAGTNGKGSCVAFLQSIFNSAGYRTGSYTSPHLLYFNERICFDGVMVDDASLVEALNQVEQARADIPLTYFEFTTLAALWLFRQAKPDVIILEVGLGGRLDAVNVVDADVAVITTIALDHMDWLGDTREAIGYEKAGIFRQGQAAVCGDFNPPLTVLQAAAECAAQLYCVNREFSYDINPKNLSAPPKPIAGTTHSYWNWHCGTTSYQQLPVPRLPLQNAATALMALRCLAERLPVSTRAMEQGLQEASLPGRFQQFHHPRWVILDVAHNPASAQLLADRLLSQPCQGQTYAVVSMLGDKDIEGSLQPLLACVDHWLVAGLDVPRGISAEMMANYLQKLGVTAYHSYDSVFLAFSHALQVSQPSDRIIVFGSFHTVTPILATLEK